MIVERRMVGSGGKGRPGGSDGLGGMDEGDAQDEWDGVFPGADCIADRVGRTGHVERWQRGPGEVGVGAGFDFGFVEESKTLAADVQPSEASAASVALEQIVVDVAAVRDFVGKVADTAELELVAVAESDVGKPEEPTFPSDWP